MSVNSWRKPSCWHLNKFRENHAKTRTSAQSSIRDLMGLHATAYPHTPVHMRNLSTLGLVMVIQGLLSPLLSFWLCLFVTAAYVSWCSLCHGYGITASLEILVFILLMQDFHTRFLSPLNMHTMVLCSGSYMYTCGTYIALSFLFLTF